MEVGLRTPFDSHQEALEQVDRTSPKVGKQRPYVASTEHVWALHDVMGKRYRAGLLLATFAGQRLTEACGLGMLDVDLCAAS